MINLTTKIKTCEICGELYEPTSPIQKYCGKACKRIAQVEIVRAKRNREPKCASVLRLCKRPGCTTRFTPLAHNHEYCCKGCYHEVNRGRVRECSKERQVYADYYDVGKKVRTFKWGRLETVKGKWTEAARAELKRREDIVQKLKIEAKYGKLTRVS